MNLRWSFQLMTAAVLGALAWLGSSRADLEAQEPANSQDPIQDQITEELRSAGVRIDLNRQLIEIDATICQNREPLEYLLVTERGKDHESLLRCTNLSAEALNTAMLLMGVEAGKNYDVREIDPPPSPEEFEAGAPLFEVEPARGDGFYLYVCWEEEDLDGEQRTRFYRAEDLVVNVQAERTYRRGQWIYLGSRFIRPHKDAEEFFAAEGEGNLISVVYFKPANHLMTGADPEAENQYIWYPNIFLMPAIDAPVRLLFSRKKIDQVPPRLSEEASEAAQ
ncbi:MAG: YdjY domain-containing protein [Planctomycetes bacterium]|nr:YdjY domain-containing protein [Planctomycetota bacterium]